MRQYFQADDKERQEWVEQQLPTIRETVRKYRAILYFQDEANVSLTAFLGKTWAPRGKTPKAQVTGQRGGIAALSAISRRGHLLFTFSHTAAEKSPDHSSPHVKDGTRIIVKRWRNLDNIAPAGSINACARDLSQWLRFQLGDGTIDGLARRGTGYRAAFQRAVPGQGVILVSMPCCPPLFLLLTLFFALRYN